MKQSLVVLVQIVFSWLLSACGNNDSESSVPAVSKQLSMTMQEVNFCGQATPFNQYEVITYTDNGRILSRHQPDSDGQLQASFKESHINMAIVSDLGVVDKKDLEVIVLAQYPVGDLGTLTRRRERDATGCQCQSANIDVHPGVYRDTRLNIPNRVIMSSQPIVNFKSVQLCAIGTGEEALVVVNHLDNDTGFIYYQAIENTSQAVVDGAIFIDLNIVGQVGRGVTVNTTDPASHWLTYVTDQRYNYMVSDKTDETTNVLDHPRVDKVAFHAQKLLDKTSPDKQLRLWGVQVPLTDSTTEVFYSKPAFKPEILSPFVSNPTMPYNFSDNNSRVIKGKVAYKREGFFVDWWYYILPDKSEKGVNFKLPPDYFQTLAEDTQYQDLIVFRAWELNEISAANSLDEIYQSDWLKVLMPEISRTDVRPPATFSYVALEVHSKNVTFLDDVGY